MDPRPDPCCGPTAVISTQGVPQRRYYRTPATAPGPSGPAMLRSFAEVSNHPLTFLRKSRERYGSVVQFPIPKPPTYLVDDAHLAQQVLQAQTAIFDKDTIQYRALSLVTGEGLLAATNEPWRVQRPVVQPAFHKAVLEQLSQDVVAATERLITRWSGAPAGSIVDAEAAMMRVGLEVVGEHLFDADLQRQAPRLAHATMAALDAVIAQARLPWAVFRGLPTPVQRRYRDAMTDLENAVAEVVAQRRASGAQKPDLIGLLLAAYPDQPDQIRDQIITFLVAGHETVAAALTWALGLLAQHPGEQRVARQNADAGHDPADLAAVRAVFDETLRLFPPAWVITRTATRDTVLGHRAIPQGALVLIVPWLLHRDPVRWPLPDVFLPERFAGVPGAVARAATTRAKYLPFGTGPRLCIGRDFAVLEGVIVLAMLLRRFRFASVGPLPAVDPLVTLRPVGGMPLRIYPR